MVNAEVLLRQHLDADQSLPPAFLDIPKTRPARFITVERTSGGRNEFRDIPLLAVQCWAGSRYEASELAALTADSVERLRIHPQVGRVNINSTYNFPDPDSQQARYQVVVELVTKG